MEKLNVGVLFSGGKDSTYTVYKCAEQGFNVSCLISIFSKSKESWMFHTPNIGLVKLQSKALGIPLFTDVTEGEKELELADLERALKSAKEKYALDAVGAGALASKYQYDRVANICSDLGMQCITPLWQKNPAEYLREMLAAGFKIRFSAIAAYGLTEKWLGRELDENALEELIELNRKHSIHIGGEGGEFESMVLDGPIFKKRVEILDAETILENQSTGIYKVKKAKLVAKAVPIPNN